jgi:hypothetical protein
MYSRYLFLLLAIAFLIIGAVSGSPTITQNNTVNVSPQVIENGGCVELNGTYDISSLGWGVPKIAYYGKYEDSFSPGNDTEILRTIDMPNTASALSSYWIDPAVFWNATGFWYQYYGNNDLSSSANLRMFRVNDTCPENPAPIQIVVALNQTNFTIPKNLGFLPDKHEADVLVARGDSSMPIDEGEPFNWWMFGTYSSIYDQPTPETSLEIPAASLLNFEPGNYDIVEVYKGHNDLLEENYQSDYKYYYGENRTHEVIISPLRSIAPVDITALTGNPRTVELKLIGAVGSSMDDSYKKRSVSFQEPEVQIMRLDALQNPSNDTWYDVRGYTNVINGTVLTVTIDPKTVNDVNRKAHVFTTTAEGLDPGSWRQFDLLVPVDYSQIFPGYHDLQITSPEGATQTVQFYIYKELPPHYIPPQYTEYLGTSPFVTPEIVTVTVPVTIVQTVTVTIPVTPPPEEVKQAHYDADTELMWQIVGTIVAVLIVLWVLVFAYRTWQRRRWHRP